MAQPQQHKSQQYKPTPQQSPHYGQQSPQQYSQTSPQQSPHYGQHMSSESQQYKPSPQQSPHYEQQSIQLQLSSVPPTSEDQYEISSPQTISVRDSQHTITDENQSNENENENEIVGAHARRETLNIEASMLGKNESKPAWLWLLYTSLYWTLLVWIPIISEADFHVNLWGLVIWCFGFVGMISTAYTVYIGHYPSGGTKEKRTGVDGMGRYTAAILSSTVIIDCVVLVYISVAVDLDNISSADAIIYNTSLCRLVLHIIHIFWASLFFYNRFKTKHPKMAMQAFLLQWTDIVWSCIVSFIITAPESVDIIYFLIVGIKLMGWMGPMMFQKRWGTSDFARSVTLHLLILDLVSDAPVIGVLLGTQSYKNNPILWIDIIWKSFLLQRSWSSYFVNAHMHRAEQRNNTGINNDSQLYGISFKTITFSWIMFVALYWNICVLLRCVFDNEIALNYEYYTWFGGMIGLFCIFDACLSGYSAETAVAKPFIAFCCLLISVDCIMHAYGLLAKLDESDDAVGEVMMAFHCIALLSSILFYSSSFKRGVGYSFVVQWIDIILMFVVIEILNSNLIHDCFGEALCVGYFVVFTVKIIVWFMPMIFGYADHKRNIHIHMTVLDLCTDGPLLLTIFITKGWTVNAFVFVDIAFKLVVLCASISYHFVINIILAPCQERMAANQ